MPDQDEKKEQIYTVYMLKCSDGTFYTGQTNDLERRVAEHNAGKHCRYTFTRRPVTAVFSEVFATRGDALRAEAFLKKWLRPDKQALINGDKALLKKLRRGRQKRGKKA